MPVPKLRICGRMGTRRSAPSWEPAVVTATTGEAEAGDEVASALITAEAAATLASVERSSEIFFIAFPPMGHRIKSPAVVEIGFLRRIPRGAPIVPSAD